MLCAPPLTRHLPIHPPPPPIRTACRPTSVRAKHGETAGKPALHVTDLPEDGPLEVSAWAHARARLVASIPAALDTWLPLFPLPQATLLFKTFLESAS